MVEAMRDLIIPQTTLITPNSIEARHLAAADDEADFPDLPECARRLIELGCEYVLITGTHENTAQVMNILYGVEGVLRSDAWQRLPGSFHGTGCTLAAAVAATLANGVSMPDAIRDAQEFTWQSLKAAFRPGMGQQIPDRLFWARAAGGDDDESSAAC
jgi:hydroxymethylpyrimidine/phosphomethylpyrimidine kinase